jgi:hypothetical protein
MLVEACICFANGHGGTVVVGGAAAPGPGSFMGCDLDPATVQRRLREERLNVDWSAGAATRSISDISTRASAMQTIRR